MNQTTDACGYIRVSREEAATEGLSLDAQKAKIAAYCKMRGLNLVGIFTDPGISGGKPLSKRGGGKEVLELVRRKKVQAVVAVKLDRLFRNCIDCLTVTQGWDKASVALHLLDMGGQSLDTGTAIGKFFLAVMASAAELEKNQMAERIVAVMEYKRSRNEYCGGKLRYGYQVCSDGVHLEEVAEEQRVIREVCRLRQRLSLRATTRALTHKGLVNRSGKPFSPAAIHQIVAFQKELLMADAA